MIPELFCSKQKTNFDKFTMREEGLKIIICVSQYLLSEVSSL